MIRASPITVETYRRAVQRVSHIPVERRKNIARLGFLSDKEPVYAELVSVFSDFFISYYEIWPPDIRRPSNNQWLGRIYVPIYGTGSLQEYIRKTFGHKNI